LKKATVLKVDQTQTVAFLNDGKGNFTMQPLPQRAQFSPVFGILASDLNGDGIKDLFLVGNFFGVKPQTGRFDANYGTTYLSDSKNQLNYMEPKESGLFVRGEARDIAPIKTANGDTMIIVAMNNEALYLFKKEKKQKN
jgi:enediyne biosynthesis protein E4